MPKTTPARKTKPAQPAANGRHGAAARKGAREGARKPARKSARKAEPFKLTYATMFNPPESLHTKYNKALAGVKAGMGRDYGMLINNQDVFSDEKFDDRSPIDTDWNLGTFQKGT